MGKELDEILEELRDLAHGLYPLVLRDLGLEAALLTLLRRSVSRVKVEAGAIGRYSEDVEAAVYFCCAESLQNVHKHAGLGATAVIRLREHDGRLFFEIVDDGAGFDLESARHAGHGLANVSERIAAHGGSLVLQSTPGRGTQRGEHPRRRRHAASRSRRLLRLRTSQRRRLLPPHGSSFRRPT